MTNPTLRVLSVVTRLTVYRRFAVQTRATAQTHNTVQAHPLKREGDEGRGDGMKRRGWREERDDIGERGGDRQYMMRTAKL